jgi:hypothetical protein
MKRLPLLEFCWNLLFISIGGPSHLSSNLSMLGIKIGLVCDKMTNCIIAAPVLFASLPDDFPFLILYPADQM